MADRTLELDADLAKLYGFMLTTNEVADVLHVDRKTVRKLASDGQLKASHVGAARAKLRFIRKEVARFVARCEDDGDDE